MVRLTELRIRDPYIVPYKDTYYLYGTLGGDRDKSIYAYKSCDMVNWEGPITIMTMPEDYWGVDEVWAPEVHVYRSKFYLFFSTIGRKGLRGTLIAKADDPEGPFIPISDKPATPEGLSCIDGTLYVENDVPYIVYSHDWPDNYINEGGYYLGRICAVQLSEDLSKAVGEPFCLFTSLDAPTSAKKPTVHPYGDDVVTRYGSDGPFMTRMSDGKLVLLWSPIPEMNYIILAAVSEDGTIHGNWKHIDTPIFDKNGGHAMIFTDFNGNKKIALHYNECYPNERGTILNVEEVDGIWKVIE